MKLTMTRTSRFICRSVRSTAWSKIDLELIEVQTGSYLGEDDIERIEDGYHRGWMWANAEVLMYQVKSALNRLRDSLGQRESFHNDFLNDDYQTETDSPVASEMHFVAAMAGARN